MKILSLWQPWASLLILGIKRYETRSWGTDFRGEFGIHAAGYWGRECDDFFRLPQIRAALEAHGIRQVQDFPFGVVLGTAVLEDVVPTDAIRDQLPLFERLLGNYADGRRAWKLGPVTRYATPVRARGRQGFWEWTAPADADLTVVG